MKRIILVVLMCVFVFGVVSAEGLAIICIDKTAPSEPAWLNVSGDVGSILLEWEAVVDEPDCSGIGEYVVSRDGVWISVVGGDVLGFVDNESLVAGSYNYTVFAVDLVGHNSGPAVKINVVLVKSGGSVYVSSSGGGGSSRCYEDWECGDWGECVDGYEERVCVDMQMCGPKNDKPEVRRECGYGGSGRDDDELVVTESDVGGDEVGFVSKVTGAVVGVVGSTGGVVVGVFVLVVLGGFFAMRVRSRERRFAKDTLC